MTSPMTPREHSKQARRGSMKAIRKFLHELGEGGEHITRDFREVVGKRMWPSDVKRIIDRLVKNRQIEVSVIPKGYLIKVRSVAVKGRAQLPTFCEVRDWVSKMPEGFEFSSIDIPDTSDKKYWISRLQKMVEYGELVREGKVFNEETHRHVVAYKVVKLLVQHPRVSDVVIEPVVKEPKKIVWEPWPVVRK